VVRLCAPLEKSVKVQAAIESLRPFGRSSKFNSIR
jgi:hypothetical protein